MKALVLIEIPDSPDYTVQDVEDALRARLDEFYPNDVVVPGVKVVAGPDAAVDLVMEATEGGFMSPDLDDRDGFDTAWTLHKRWMQC